MLKNADCSRLRPTLHHQSLMVALLVGSVIFVVLKLCVDSLLVSAYTWRAFSNRGDRIPRRLPQFHILAQKVGILPHAESRGSADRLFLILGMRVGRANSEYQR